MLQRTGLAFGLLPLMMAGAVMAGQVSVIPPTVIITPPPPVVTPPPTPVPAPVTPPVNAPVPVVPVVPVTPATPTVGVSASSVANARVSLAVTPPPVPPAVAAQVPQVVSSFPVSAMSTSGLGQAAELTRQAIQNPSLGPSQVEALTNLKNAIRGELDNRK